MTPTLDVYGTQDEHPLVLVADDHDDSRVIARLVLESAGFEVVEASTGHEAITLAHAHHPAAILLDMIMPELDGWDTARRLRSDTSMNSIAIIGLT
ncbi:MAG TPA: response regulator, partial [Gemmatimonadaceae bacterium]